jgi:hypothetical protein
MNLQLQDSTSSDKEIDALPFSKTALLCKLAQVTLEIWMTLSLDTKKWLLNEREQVTPEIWMALSLGTEKWLLNERECQQQEKDKYKKSSDTNGNNIFKVSERNKNTSSNIPNQDAKVKNTVK